MSFPLTKLLLCAIDAGSSVSRIKYLASVQREQTRRKDKAIPCAMDHVEEFRGA